MPLIKHAATAGRRGSLVSLFMILIFQISALSETPGGHKYFANQNGVSAIQDGPRNSLVEADLLAGSGDTEGAIRILKPLAESDRATVAVLTKLGQLYGKKKDYVGAVGVYRKAIELAGSEVGNHALNLRMQLGAALFLLQQFKEAIPEIEAGLTHWSHTPDDFLPYKMLALAYERTGASAAARQANIAVLAAYPASPDAWAALGRLGPPIGGTESQTLRTNVPSSAALTEFAEVLALGDPSKWSIGDLAKGLPAYMRYAEVLEKVNRILSAGNVRRIGGMMAVKVMDESVNNNHPEDAIQAFLIIEHLQLLDNLPLVLQRKALSNLLVVHARLNQYVHSIAAAERLLGLPVAPNERDVDKQIVVVFLVEVFNSVSWDRAKQLRTNDTNDFSDLNNLRTSAQGRSAIGSRSAGAIQNVIPGTQIPYGMVSPDEDSATIAQNLHAKGFADLVAIRISQGNFELPVKSLLSQIIEPYKFRVLAGPNGLEELGLKDLSLEQLEASELNNISGQFLKDLDEAILKTDPEKIAETTLDAYTVARRALRLLKSHKQ